MFRDFWDQKFGFRLCTKFFGQLTSVVVYFEIDFFSGACVYHSRTAEANAVNDWKGEEEEGIDSQS